MTRSEAAPAFEAAPASTAPDQLPAVPVQLPSAPILPERGHGGSAGGSPRRPYLTVAIFLITVIVSVVALGSPTLMRLFTRDLTRLRHGQWWRSITPVLVQPSGWGQLGFNMLGLGLVGAALERRLSRSGWALTYLLGGVGGIAFVSAWHPTDTDGGSSAAVAALVGALVVLLAADGGDGWLDRAAQLYSVFFAAYLTALALGGVLPSIIAGNASIMLAFAAHRAFRPATVARLGLVVVVVGGVLMTLAKVDHGTGILSGVALASAVLVRRGRRTR